MQAYRNHRELRKYDTLKKHNKLLVIEHKEMETYELLNK